jgi:hypothetical protein
LHHPLWSVTAGAVTALIGVRLLLRLRRSNFGWTGAALSFVGLPVFVHLLLRSHRAHRGLTPLTWKGRPYVGERIGRRATGELQAAPAEQLQSSGP